LNGDGVSGANTEDWTRGGDVSSGMLVEVVVCTETIAQSSELPELPPLDPEEVVSLPALLEPTEPVSDSVDWMDELIQVVYR